MIPSKEILKAKIDTRQHSRELIKIVFNVTEGFPKNDEHELGLTLRKKALAISSFLSHGTVKFDREEQNENFLTVMAELREVLKLITIAHHLQFTNDSGKVAVRVGIANVINELDKLVILLGGFNRSTGQ